MRGVFARVESFSNHTDATVLPRFVLPNADLHPKGTFPLTLYATLLRIKLIHLNGMEDEAVDGCLSLIIALWIQFL